MAPLLVARENALYATPLPFLQEPLAAGRPWSARSGGGGGGSQRLRRGWGAPETDSTRPGWTPCFLAVRQRDSLYFSEPLCFLCATEGRGALSP